MTHLLLFTAFVLWYADFEGKDDAQEIAEHLTIDHTHQWIERAVAFFCAWFITWIICSLPSTWPLLIGHAFLFSAVFRYRLNKLRGLHWAYVSPSSWYDHAFMFLSGFRGGRKYWNNVWHMNVVVDNIKPAIHRAGTTAYLTEITLFALGTAGAIMLL